jgi:CBS domain-containing protein
MTREVVTAGEDEPLGGLVDLMERHRIKRVPIVRGGAQDGVLAGVVSRSDLLRAVLSREPDQPVLQPTDRALRELVVAALENQPWTSRWPVNVFANDGVVHLWGFVEGEEVRKAYRVAAENVPGVRRVKNHLRGLPASVAMGT